MIVLCVCVCVCVGVVSDFTNSYFFFVCMNVCMEIVCVVALFEIYW